MATAKTAATKTRTTATTTSGKGFAADAETLKNAATKPMRAASKAELKVAAKKPSKAATPAVAKSVAAPKPAKGAPSQHVVRTVKDLIKVLSTSVPVGGSFDVERKFGNPTIQVKNIRGRVVAEIQQMCKLEK